MTTRLGIVHEHSAATDGAQTADVAAQTEVAEPARERAELLVRKTHLRLLEEQRARTAAEWTARALRVTSEATAALLSSFDYAAVLRHVARIIAGHIACGCVVDLAETDGQRRIAQVPLHSEPTIALALGPLVAEVLASCAAQASTTRGFEDGVAFDGADGAESEDACARARRILAVDWIVCTPIAADGETAIGVLTIFGSVAKHPPIPVALAAELAERAAIAVENGRNYRRAVEALRQREQVLTMVSHDLKNPLGVILMSAARILEKLPPEQADIHGRPQVELIQRSARRMLKLVSDLLDLSAIDAGQITMTAQPVSIRTLVLTVFEELGAQAATSGIELVCDVPDTLPPARADGSRLTQILVNLIGNAIKFTPAGGRVTARATLLDTAEVAITIADTGVGIHRDHLEHIFDRFWQGPMGFRSGSGLGLAICRSLVERSGGHISAESTPGAGTAITFTLPTGLTRARASFARCE
jgi:signal transduction histidine kinase